MDDSIEMSLPIENWREPPDELALADRDVHVWYVHPLKSPSAAAWAVLSSDERAAADRFKFDRDRDRYVACRSALRNILARCLNELPGQLRFRYGPQGKPFLIDRDVHFNVSHSQDHGLIAVTHGAEIGVDIESLNTSCDPLELSQQFFTLSEAELVRRTPSEKRRWVFLNLWTRKEALMKAIGTGLSEPLDRFDNSSVTNDGESGINWTVHVLRPSSEVVGALVTAGGVDAVCRWNFVTRASSP
jgi:4'-phosphopantetheinyl transferase